MNALIIGLTGLVIMSLDPKVPQKVKTATWIVLILVALAMAGVLAAAQKSLGF